MNKLCLLWIICRSYHVQSSAQTFRIGKAKALAVDVVRVQISPDIFLVGVVEIHGIVLDESQDVVDQ